MMYKTHLTTSLNISIPVLALNNELSLLTLTGVSLGSLLPDIDTPYSFIGARLKIISYPLSIFFKHRGGLHSIIPIIIILWIGILLNSKFILSVSLGYFLHLLGDTFSRSGVNWFWPFSNKSIKIPIKLLTYKTGSIKEYVILFISILILIGEFKIFITF
ncbi:metal-dependent hydrolase [Clostridium perfringens]|uniref:metal-dependent hydrolase n=1 Tax=Clostridium perfringens TaxID=1502 RepID=UPI0013E384C3|nr:metal-dependent hydrolase [Clostridium perfringens]NGT68456.1 metal-dependent hydrolase [Clostridium perfringens]